MLIESKNHEQGIIQIIASNKQPITNESISNSTKEKYQQHLIHLTVEEPFYIPIDYWSGYWLDNETVSDKNLTDTLWL